MIRYYETGMDSDGKPCGIHRELKVDEADRNRWIPVTEKMPPDNLSVYVTTVDNKTGERDVETDSYGAYNGRLDWWDNSNNGEPFENEYIKAPIGSGCHVIAWQYIEEPEVYEGE